MNSALRSPRISYHDLHTHETKRHVFIKFLIVLTIVLAYFSFIAYKYGLEQGFFVAALTWSFFVMCTPVADAGFLIDFPLRLVTFIKMVYSEMLVWTLAIGLNIYAIFFQPEVYDDTKFLIFFKHILLSPFPGWSIVISSMIGTFVSIKFGDELLNNVHHRDRAFYHKHKHKFRLLVMVFLIGMSVIVYNFVLHSLHLEFPI